MRQAADPLGILRSLQGQSGLDNTHDYVPSLDERTSELKKQGAGSLCKLQAKKTLAGRLLALSVSVRTDMTTVDANSSTSLALGMNGILNEWSSKNLIKNMANDRHSLLIAKLFDMVEVINEGLKRQQGGGGGT